jgi:hypothetical protein
MPDYLMVAYGSIGKPALPDEVLFAARGETLSQIIATSVGDWHPILRSLISAVGPSSCFPYALRSLPVTPDWHPSQVTMIGDAIHAMPPSFGAGTNSALWGACGSDRLGRARWCRLAHGCWSTRGDSPAGCCRDRRDLRAECRALGL